jgi:hypothetical protein
MWGLGGFYLWNHALRSRQSAWSADVMGESQVPYGTATQRLFYRGGIGTNTELLSTSVKAERMATREYVLA